MVQWILSASALILIWLLLRGLTWKKISCRMQYAICLVVLLRLLIPWNITLTKWVEPEVRTADTQTVTDTVKGYVTKVENSYTDAAQNTVPEKDIEEIGADGWIESENQRIQEENGSEELQSNQELTRATIDFDAVAFAGKMAEGIWCVGMFLMASSLGISNLVFYLRIRRNRKWIQDVKVPIGKVAVYQLDEAKQPFLFGIFRPSIYINQMLLEEREKEFALEHELAHFRQLDFIWNTLRAIALVIHWFNPLVWIYCRISKEDAEFSCDEQVLKKVGDEGTVPYGELLLQLAAGKNAEKKTTYGLLCSEMMGRRKIIMRRIEQISNKTRRSKLVTVCMILAMLLLMAGCQTSVKEQERTQTPQVTDEPATEGETEKLSSEQDEKDAEAEELSSEQAQKDAGIEIPMEIAMSGVEDMAAGKELYPLTDIIGEMDFYQQMNENVKETMMVDGEVYGIPGTLYGMGLMYRADLFEQAGLVDEDGMPLKPDDWTLLAEYAAVLKEKTGAGLAFPGGDMAGTWQFMNIATAFGATDFTTVDEVGNVKAMMNTEEMKQALTYLASLKWQYNCLTDSVSEANMMTGYEELANGKAAMYMGANDAIYLTEDYGMDAEVLGIWGLPKGEDGRIHPICNGLVYAFPAGASKEDVQQGVTKLQEEGLIIGGNAFPINGKVKEEYAGDYVDTMKEAVLQVEKNMPYQTSSEFYLILTDVVQKVLSDENADIDALLLDANESYDKVLSNAE